MIKNSHSLFWLGRELFRHPHNINSMNRMYLENEFNGFKRVKDKLGNAPNQFLT